MLVRRLHLVICFSLSLAVAALGRSPDAYAQGVWADAELGAGTARLPDSFGDFAPSKVGPAFGLGAGLRFSAWTIGLRGHLVPTSTLTLYQGALEAGFHPSAGRWDPYVSVHGGYAVIGMRAIALPFPLVVGSGEGPQPTSFTPANPRGPDLGLAFGVDYRVTSHFTLGLGVSADMLFLTMPARYISLPGGSNRS